MKTENQHNNRTTTTNMNTKQTINNKYQTISDNQQKQK